MNSYLKDQLHTAITITVLWIIALCATIYEYQYYISGTPSCFKACIPPIIIGACLVIYFWWVWAIDYKKYKNKE